ncbi:hypothetical protein Avbf_12653 [Armadillidium vulgare]|nr:hypothetical protein Avbf_12653 [Armadillidium vulgare]
MKSFHWILIEKLKRLQCIRFLITMSANINKNTNLYCKYDLSTNYLHEVQIKSLEKICILTAVVNAFEYAEALEEIRRLFLGHGQNNPGNLYMIVLNILGVKYLPRYFKREILLTIKLVHEEIERFLKSIFLESDKSLFIGNYVFNWQGGIDPRQTVLKVLNSNKLSPMKKFEFSCKYLLDEQIIQSYFEVLTPNIQNFYSNSEIYFGPFHSIISYFIKKFRSHLQWQPVGFEDTSDIKIKSCKFFLSYLKSNYCTVIGVQFLFENFSLCHFHTSKAFKYLLTQESRDHKINISVYLICRLHNDVLINRFAFDILTNLIA